MIQSCNKEPYAVEHAFMRLPAGAGTNSAVFFTFKNQSDVDVKIVAASSSLNAKIEIHNVTMKDNMMHMHQVDYVEVKADASQLFKSGSFHVMVMGIKDKVAEHDKVSFTLTLDNNKTVSFDAMVQNMTAKPSMQH